MVLDDKLCSFIISQTTNLLIDHGSSLSQHSSQDLSILHMAAESGNVECCELLLAHNLDFNTQTLEGITPLISAIHHRNNSVITYFISKGCILDQQPNSTLLALNEAIKNDIDIDIIEKLLASGASPDISDKYCTLPLWHAVEKENLSVVKLLMQCNSQLAVESSCAQCSPCTPLVHAIHKENFTLVHWLISAFGDTAVKSIRKIINSVNTAPNLHIYINSLGEPISSNFLSSLATVISAPQSLLCQSRRAVRQELGCGYVVNQKIASLKLPSLLHNYMLYSDLESLDYSS